MTGKARQRTVIHGRKREMACELFMLYGSDGDTAWLKAAKALDADLVRELNAVPRGRPAQNDDDALLDMADLIRDRGLTVYAAACEVAPYVDGNSDEAVVDRLRKKYAARDEADIRRAAVERRVARSLARMMESYAPPDVAAALGRIEESHARMTKTMQSALAETAKHINPVSDFLRKIGRK